MNAKQQGERIRQLRKVTHLSRRAFSLKHNLSPGTLQNCEDGRYKSLSKKVALKLIKAFQDEGINCQLEWLLAGTGLEPLHRFKLTNQISPPRETANNINLLQQTIENEKLHKINAKLFNAASGGRYHEVTSLIENGLDIFLAEGVQIKSYESEHNTPLHLAALNGHLEIVKFLIKSGANVNARNRKNQTPLHMAVHNAHRLIVEYLILNQANIDVLDSEGDTPLAWAAYKGQLSIASQLIHLSANIDIKNNLGNTPLHWAADEGHLEIVKLFVSHSANTEILNDHNQTPLQLAVSRGQIEVVKFLLQNK